MDQHRPLSRCYMTDQSEPYKNCKSYPPHWVVSIPVVGKVTVSLKSHVVLGTFRTILCLTTRMESQGLSSSNFIPDSKNVMIVQKSTMVTTTRPLTETLGDKIEKGLVDRKEWRENLEVVDEGVQMRVTC